jgi:hypothetical protein
MQQPRKKVYRSVAQWRAIVARYERSGLPQAAFCTREGIALHSFKKHYRRHKPGEAARGQFVAVPVPASPSREWEVELTLPNGVRLAMRGVGRVE